MEFFNRMHLNGIHRRLWARVQGLSKSRKNRLPDLAALKRFRKRLAAAALLMTALVLGVWAQAAAETSALSTWLRSHPPSERMWRHALLSRGLHQINDPKLLQKAAKTLPALVDDEGSVWISADSSWIAIFQPQNTGLASAIYCWECGKPPAGWTPSGKGWEAFDPLLERLDLALAQRKVASRPTKSAVSRDPREIRY